MVKRFFTYLHNRIFYIWLLFFSFLTVILSPEKGTHYGFAATYILFYLIYVFNEKLFFFVLLFITICLSCYYPIFVHHSSLNSGIVAAVLETNVAESLEFLKKFSLSDFILPFLYVLSFVILMRLKKFNKKGQNIEQGELKKQRLLHTVLSLVVIFCITFSPTQYYFKFRDDDDLNAHWTLANSPVNVISFYGNIYESITDYFIEKKELAEAQNLISPWQVASVESKYKNYVLIIGESARKDYLSTYGFNIKTSPFLDSVNGYINSGYIAAAPATYHSFLNSFYLKKKNEQTGKRDYSYNIVTLAKSAKIKTFWLSNQGTLGKYDTIASRIGVSADFSYFTKKAGYNTDNVNDFKLIEILKQKINEQTENDNTGARLYILHLMGSHAAFCSRLEKDEHQYEFINKNVSCYVNTILKTDRLIEKVVDVLKEKNESYSVIYFSDHGLSHTDKEDKEKISLDHGVEYKQNYAVPFVKISSDDTERKTVNTQRSALNFIYGFSQWLGIKTKELNRDYDFFSENADENIKVFNFEKYVPFNELKDDEIPYNLTKE